MWQLCLAAAFSQGVTGPWLSMITVTFDSMVTQVNLHISFVTFHLYVTILTVIFY